MKWVIAALATLLLWGLWGVLLKRVSQGGTWYQVYVATNTAIVVVVAIVAVAKGLSWAQEAGWRWFALSFITGLAGTLGYILLVLSMEWGGKASIVVPLTSLYPAVTVVLSRLILGETLSIRQEVGVILAIIAVVLLSLE
ncbi:MAG: EamA family transporter [Desulfurococcales archaeon]|nr:EamA family transporter [Desulfurococcales archaeon]